MALYLYNFIAKLKRGIGKLDLKSCVMKTLNSFLLLSLLLSFVTAVLSCEEVFNDPCDDTSKPEISASISATVHILDKNKIPIPNQQVNIFLYKIPCGAEAKGQMDFSGPTDEQGIRKTTTANYNLRNLEDQVWVDVHAVNLGNGSAMADSEYVMYKYSDFIVGTPKEVHVYIYRNF